MGFFGDAMASRFGGIYFRIKTDETHVFAPVGEPRFEKTEWDQARKRTVAIYWDPTDPNDRPNRVAFNAYLPDSDRIVIYEGPGSLCRDLVRARLQPGDVVSVTRTGSGKSTRFEFSKQSRLEGAEWERIEAMQRHDLQDMWTAGDAPRGEAPSESDDPKDAIPF